MKKILLISFIIYNLIACNQQTTAPVRQSNAALNKMFDDYYEERLKLFPLEACIANLWGKNWDCTPTLISIWALYGHCGAGA
jgi:hypothetical protein